MNELGYMYSSSAQRDTYGTHKEEEIEGVEQNREFE
jgi:hypothetical protein